MSLESNIQTKADTILYEYLESIVNMNEDLVMLKDSKIILDTKCNNGKVNLISAGKAAIQLSDIQFVGPGMLNATVLGSTLSSPSIRNMLTAVEAVSSQTTSSETLLFVQDQPQYQINYILTQMYAEQKGYTIKILPVNEDILKYNTAQDLHEHGLPSRFFMYKLAAAMSQQGKTLHEIYSFCSKIINNEEVISIGLYPKQFNKLNEQATKATKEYHQLINQHGRGELHNLEELNECVYQLLPFLSEVLFNWIENQKATKNVNPETLPSVFDIGILINYNGLSQVMANIFTSKIINHLQTVGFAVKRVYLIPLPSLLDCTWIDISILNFTFDTMLIEYLDARALVPGWPKFTASLRISSKNGIAQSTSHDSLKGNYQSTVNQPEDSCGPILKDTRILFKIISTACIAIIVCKDQLNLIDSEFDDRNCGTTLSSAADRINAFVQERQEAISLYSVFMQLSEIMQEVEGWHSGIYCSFFDAIAKSFLAYETDSDITAKMLSDALAAGITAISTMENLRSRSLLNALVPANLKLTEELNKGEDPLYAFGEAVKAAEKFASDTVYLHPNHKKSSWYKICKYPDPGAHAVGIWMRGAYEAAKLNLTNFSETK